MIKHSSDSRLQCFIFRGRSLDQKFSDGDYLFIDLDIHPVDSDYVIAKSLGQMILGKLHRLDMGFEISSVTPNCEVIKSHLTPVEIIGRVIKVQREVF